MAKFRADISGGNPIITKFEFDSYCLKGNLLNVKIFDEYSDEWAHFILQNRQNSSRDQLHPYDIVYGPIANDKVGSQIRRYENGDIDFKEFLRRLQYMKGPTYQYFFATEKSLNFLKKL